ncbi:unnamed protein product, partial [Mesorhabditis belari]|uniref:Uncharacterized protein n=1 Tax=Mesorhabditis belari TaxID=2138241 RepID=A0AAF3EV42_9BILA
MRVWLWHSTKTVEYRPDSKDYRCCCGALRSKRCFTVLILCNLAFFLYDGLKNGFVQTISDPIEWVQFALCVLVTVFAVLSIITLRPIFMQLYIISGIIYYGAMFSEHFFEAYRCVMEFLEVKGKEPEQAELDAFWDLVFSVGVILFFSPIIFWGWYLTHSVYAYIRDRQLFHEQQDDRILTTVYTEAVPMTKEE